MVNNPSLGAHPGRAGVLSHKMDIAVIGLGFEAATASRGEGRVGGDRRSPGWHCKYPSLAECCDGTQNKPLLSDPVIKRLYVSALCQGKIHTGSG